MEPNAEVLGLAICLLGQILTLTLGQILMELIKDFVLLLWKSDSRRKKKEKEKEVYIQRCVKYHSFAWTESQQESTTFFFQLQIS